MKKQASIAASIVTVGALGFGGLMTAGGAEAHTASSAISNGCGSGYSVVKDGHRTISKNGVKWGDVYLTYNARNGYNCVVTVKTKYHGSYTPTLARIDVSGDGKGYFESWHKFAHYSVVKAYGKGKCVAYWGDIRPTWSPNPHASNGRWAWGNCG